MMIDFKPRYFVLLFLCTCLAFAGCKDAWKDHTEINIERLDRTLFEQISNDANLSTFTSYVVKTGYDAVLKSSKSFTVWAPSNEALKSIDATVVNDTTALKRLVGNYIANQSYFTTSPKPSMVIRMLNGKNTIFTKTTFEEANISQADVYVKNGVLHTINAASMPKANAWEFLQSLSTASLQKDFIKSQEQEEVDTSKGVLLYKDPVTTKGVYQEGTTFKVIRNRYFQRISNISSEDSLMTYIILNNTAFTGEQNKLAAYNKHANALYADTLTKWSVVRDLVVNKVYGLNEIPDSMTTVTGVKIHLDKSAIVETRLLSNGIAYVVNSIGYKLMENKIPTVIIQGEMPDSLRVPANPLARIKNDPQGKRFTDLQTGSITSSPSPLYYYRYKSAVHSVKYEVYWRAINDILVAPISMKVDFNTSRSFGSVLFPLATVGYRSVPSIIGLAQGGDAYRDAYKEVYLGTYTADTYGTLYTFLASSLAASSTAPTALSLDYIKLKPVN
ncbi:hypothetical protein QFZ20_000485 [Flavobacterium sp. W4I14]|nr:hypothetical protein [Flavobacterium sp. W4I14]